MFKYFTYKSTTRCADVLSDLLYLYNRRRNLMIGRAPNKVTKENESSIKERMYDKEVHSTSAATFKVDDKVRISKMR